MVHALALCALGLFASWLVVKTEKFPVIWLLTMLIVIFVTDHVYTALVLFAELLLGSVAWWQIGIASLLAAVLMWGYLLRVHPLLRRELKDIAASDTAV